MTRYKGYYNRAGAMSSYEATPDGGLLVHNVVIMAAGQWTDMHGITPVFSEEVLQRCAQAWEDTAVWTRHAGGAPRSVTEKVGAVLNPTYSPTEQAVVGDVFLHCRTDASRACANLVQIAREQGGITDVSAETMVEIDAKGNVLDVVFTGLALVEDGACETCRLPAYSVQEDKTMTDEDKQKEVTETTETETTEVTAQDNKDLLELLIPFVSGLIPDSKAILDEVMGAEGEDRIRALGKLEGCMGAFGFTPETMVDAEAYAKVLDERLTAFSKTVDEKIAGLQNTIAQFSAPTGLKGHAGAEKQEAADRPTVTFYGRGRTALY